MRADFRCLSSAEGERYVWEQQLADTPFERQLRTRGSRSACARRTADGGQADRGAGAAGMSRLGSPMMRRASGEILDEALDGIERGAA